ncbi:farnesyl pyrophosphate synthase-like [Rhagoletis pomonella]|uniref:farnesyl pyrophosphate synthase-like n=1 Tax=Rhagoletis pomonella TaxID=28610 RepID=UPI00177EA718|nr:farnesyl pyrophosphate synthase-like [Rhagoletis pomonella]XP_036344544.1 farnesyl pyrophosphate synthase-like [Rhagoletis pomonella]
MFSLTRKWSQLRSSVNAITSASATNSSSSNNGISNGIHYHWETKHNTQKLALKAPHEHKLLKRYERTLSTLTNHSVPIAGRVTISKEESRDFMAVFPDVVRELSEVAKSYKTHEAATWFTKALEYNVPLGKKNRGLLTVLTYKNLVKPDDLTPENIKLAQYLGWCVEMLQCFFIISDDIMDNSTTRRGQLCWHKLEEVGLIAINDALMIENGIFELLRKNFRHLACYVDLLELFHQITFITTCGQSLDLLNANKNVSTFTMDKYDSIVANKTAYYTFYLPVALALHLAGVKDREIFRQSKTILLEMGHLFQVQDDFLDCFGNSDITGKIGTDIQDNKCSWLAVVCMQRASAEQKAIMEECYGKNDPEKIARVKQLYEELDIASLYAIYEEEKYNLIKTHIQQSSLDIPHEIFLQILNKIYQRDS